MDKNTRVAIRVQDDIGILDIDGEVTSFSEKVLEEHYEKLTAEGIKKIGFNFTGVAYINSAGMAVLISILTKSRQRAQTLKAWGLTEHFQKIFEMVGITKYMDHVDKEVDALQQF